MTSQSLTVIGIDPGYDRVGWCVGQAQGQDFTVVRYDAITTSRNQDIFQRYQSLIEQFNQVLIEFQPQEAAIETLFFSKNQKTALRVSEARGVLLSCLMNHHVQCFEYNPNQVKQAVTGYGQADKSALERMIRLQYHLENAKILDDVMDAIGIAMTHSVSRQLLHHTQLV